MSVYDRIRSQQVESLTDSHMGVGDPFIEYGPGGRELKDARDEKGVAEGLSSTAADGVSDGLNDFTSKSA